VRITLVHNPESGDDDRLDPDALLTLIRKAGHGVRYQSVREQGWEAALAQPADLVVVAGGDGTVGSVAKRMIGRGIPLAVLPLGTANNISRTLGVADLSPEAQIAGWQTWPRQNLDVGLARGPWGTSHFIEAFGSGLFAWVMPVADASATLSSFDRADEKISYAIKMLQDRLHQCLPQTLEATLDGRDLSGDYVLFEAMIMQYVGPNLYLAPDVRLGDGLLDIVLVTQAERDKFSSYLSTWQQGVRHPPELSSHRGRHLQLRWSGYYVHLDDTVWPDDDAPPAPASGTIEVTIEPTALQVVAPKPPEMHGVGAA
jgi:diacylglycerol kinase (ATP)